MWTAALPTRILWMKARTGTGNSAILRADVHQNDVRADFTYTVPGNTKVIPAAPEPQIFAWPRDDDGADTSVRYFYFHILDKAESSSVCNADDFLALKLGEF